MNLDICLMNRVYLLLGSNAGNREQILNDAVELLIERLLPDYMEVEDLSEAINTSAVHETEPWGFESNDKFLNQAFMCLTELDACKVLDVCLGIEKELGRVRPENAYNDKGERIYASRTIDIDILLFDKYTDGRYVACKIDTPSLQVPHPRLHERLFALEPLAEIAPKYLHPVIGKPIAAIKRHLKGK